MRVLLCLASLAVVVSARPGNSFGGGDFGGSSFGQSLDSYAAPNGNSGPSGSYGAPAPQYGAPAQAPVIHKHVYVHVPPPEPVYYAPKRVYAPAVPQKHYKIVFIKAPTAPTPTVPELPPIVENEQKTLIYVLVKKPEEAPEINIPTPAPTQPSKPEVYFIRYKTQKQEGYPAAQQPQSEYGAPAGPSAPSDSYGGPVPNQAPANTYGAP